MRQLTVRGSVTVQRNVGAGGQNPQSESITVQALPLGDSSERERNENRKLFRSTPSLTLQLRLDNPDAFGALDGASEVLLIIQPIDNRSGRAVTSDTEDRPRGVPGSPDPGSVDPRHQPHAGQPGYRGPGGTTIQPERPVQPAPGQPGSENPPRGGFTPAGGQAGQPPAPAQVATGATDPNPDLGTKEATPPAAPPNT